MSKDTHVDRDLDLSNANRGFWLVKVPNYISKRWEQASGDMEVGKLTIAKKSTFLDSVLPSLGLRLDLAIFTIVQECSAFPTCFRAKGQKPQVSLSLSNPILELNEPGERNIPKDHMLDVSNVTQQTLGVFSHRSHTNIESSASEPNKVLLEGKIIQKLDFKPRFDDSYVKMKLESIRKACEPARRVQQLDRVVQNYKPVADHKNNIEYMENKKAKGKKCRDDKEVVVDRLFAAFEKHQYYNIKDLVKVTNQPITFLKEILREVCDYNMKNPHKNMWELKPEYRHYKNENIGVNPQESDDEAY